MFLKAKIDFAILTYFADMAKTVSASDVEASWADLVKKNNSLPATLRPHQRDALMYLLNGHHVINCVGTGRED